METSVLNMTLKWGNLFLGPRSFRKYYMDIHKWPHGKKHSVIIFLKDNANTFRMQNLDESMQGFPVLEVE